MDGAKLKSIMVLHGDTVKSLAQQLGITPASLSAKINETNSEFKQGEIAKIKELYHLTAEQIENIFFSR